MQTALRSRASGDRFAFDALVVGGGDGTISTAAGHLADAASRSACCRWARSTTSPRTWASRRSSTSRRWSSRRAHARDIDVGEVNGRVFVNNSSIGIYPYMVEAREERRRALGLGKWWAMVLASGVDAAPLSGAPALHPDRRGLAPAPDAVRIHRQQRLRARCDGIGTRAALDRGELCLYIARTGNRLTLLWLMVKAVLGRLKPAQDFELIRDRGDRDQFAIDAPARRGRWRAGEDEAAAALPDSPARAARAGPAVGDTVIDAPHRAHLRPAFRPARSVGRRKAC